MDVLIWVLPEVEDLYLVRALLVIVTILVLSSQLFTNENIFCPQVSVLKVFCHRVAESSEHLSHDQCHLILRHLYFTSALEYPVEDWNALVRLSDNVDLFTFILVVDTLAFPFFFRRQAELNQVVDARVVDMVLHDG